MQEKIGHYKLLGELGRGGMGVVYKGHDDSLNRDVAIKVLADRLAVDDAVVERFKREAKSMGALNDPHIIQIYFIGEDGDSPYFVMEFVDGESLSDRLKRDGRLPVAEAVRILGEAAKGLATAHDRGVIHRDVKPGNLMLGADGTIKIADFGIAMVQDYSKRLTNTGEFVGTPGYLSPEVCVGQPVDHRSDIFALGIVFYEMLTGDIPFTEASPLGMMLEVVKAEIPDVRSVNKDVDARTCAILKNMIAKDPAKRYQSCRDLLRDLSGAGEVSNPAGPSSAEFSSAATRALTQMESLSAEDLRAKPTVVSGPVQQVVAPATKEKRNRVPLAIAALVVLGLGVGAAYEYRNRISGEEGGDSLKLVQTADAPAQASGSADSTSGNPDPESATWGLGDAADTAADEAAPTADETQDAGAAGWMAAAVDSLNKVEALADTLEGEPGQAEAARQPLAADENLSKTIAAAARETSAAVDEAQSGLQEAAAALEALQKNAEPLQVATAKPPPVAVAPAGPPKIVVVAVGDRAIAGPVEQLLEEALVDSEHLLIDEGFFPDIGRYAGTDHVDLPGLSSLIRQNGGDILVLAQVDYLGETPLEYYGQYSTLYSVNIKVSNILLAEHRPVGRGWLQKVDFTTLNAAEKAREAIQPILAEFTESLSDY